jgi:ParB-like chromosome segregation protein Spo0J
MILVPIEKIRSKRNFCFIAETTEAYEDRIKILIDDISKRGLDVPLAGEFQGEFYVIFDGHHRLEALKRMGWKMIPCENEDERPRPCPRN